LSASGIVPAKQHLQVNAAAIAALGHYRACIGMRKDAMERIDLAGQLAHKDVMVYYPSATALCALGEEEQTLDVEQIALSLGYLAHMVDANADVYCFKQVPK